jgi:hypothetical protein
MTVLLMRTENTIYTHRKTTTREQTNQNLNPFAFLAAPPSLALVSAGLPLRF